MQRVSVAMYLVCAGFLGEDVSNESLLHFFLLDQKLPQTFHGQRRVVASPEINRLSDTLTHVTLIKSAALALMT